MTELDLEALKIISYCLISLFFIFCFTILLIFTSYLEEKEYQKNKKAIDGFIDLLASFFKSGKGISDNSSKKRT